MDKKSLAQKKLWILDMDGTVYLGNQLFPETLHGPHSTDLGALEDELPSSPPPAPLLLSTFSLHISARCVSCWWCGSAGSEGRPRRIRQLVDLKELTV